jgi:hypothetical protein
MSYYFQFWVALGAMIGFYKARMDSRRYLMSLAYTALGALAGCMVFGAAFLFLLLWSSVNSN